MPVLRTPGARISYARAGSGPAVLLIQGAGVVGEGWRPQVDRLSEAYTLFAFDNRGFGRSVLEEDGCLTIEDMARDALAIMDAEGIPAFHLVGHSMGGLIAQEIALNARDRVKSLALLCTFVRGVEGARMAPATIVTALRMRIGTKQMRRKRVPGADHAGSTPATRRSPDTRPAAGAALRIRSRESAIRRHAAGASDGPV